MILGSIDRSIDFGAILLVLRSKLDPSRIHLGLMGVHMPLIMVPEWVQKGLF